MAVSWGRWQQGSSLASPMHKSSVLKGCKSFISRRGHQGLVMESLKGRTELRRTHPLASQTFFFFFKPRRVSRAPGTGDLQVSQHFPPSLGWGWRPYYSRRLEMDVNLHGKRTSSFELLQVNKYSKPF